MRDGVKGTPANQVSLGQDEGMGAADAELLGRVAARARSEVGELPSRLGDGAIRRAERALGFTLHPLLAAVYREVANGGFGPDYQLLSLIDGPAGQDATNTYLRKRAEGEGTDWAWPRKVLPILDWGDGMYACVDCHSEQGTVLLFEPNPGDPNLAWYVDTPTLADWLENCVLRDTVWWTEEDAELVPWPHARRRA